MICVEGRILGKYDGYVLIENERIIRVGKGKCKDSVEKIKGNVILPGFVNGHVHTGVYLYKNSGKEEGLENFFEEILFPIEKQITNKEIYEGAKLACEEMIESGITGMFNMNPWWRPVARAVKKTGIRASLSIAIKKMRDLKKNLKIPENMHPMLGIANEKETPKEIIQEVVKASKLYGWGIHTHLAESTSEVDFVRENYGKTSVEYFDSLGVLKKNTLLVHMIHVNENELKVVKKRGCTITLNPRCNELLGVGRPMIKKMIGLGLPLMLGTDEPVVDPIVDVRKIGVYVMKKYKIGFQKVLEMLTNGSFFGKYGLRKGALADITIWNCKLTEVLKTKPEYVIIDGKIII